MKTLLKLTLVAILFISSSSLSAQKMGYVNTQELLYSMPERDSVQTKAENFATELREMLEIMQVEFNNKIADYQKQMAAGMSDAVRELKETELQELRARSTAFEESAKVDIDKEYSALMHPVIKKLQDAIEKVSKDNGFLIVYDQSAGSIAYMDKSILVDVSPLIRTYLGIKEPVATPAGAAKK